MYILYQAVQLLAALNRIASSHLSDKPKPGSSPLVLLKRGRFMADQESFDLVGPYLLYKILVSDVGLEELLRLHCSGHSHGAHRQSEGVKEVCSVREKLLIISLTITCSGRQLTSIQRR